MNDWHSQVYHENTESDWYPEGWAEIRKSIIKRDKKCYRCETGNWRKLTVHHIIPREEDGKENPENLISLCQECHDIVEMAGCRSLLDIINTIEKEEVVSLPLKTRKPDMGREESFERPEWHKWVYGGQRRKT